MFQMLQIVTFVVSQFLDTVESNKNSKQNENFFHISLYLSLQKYIFCLSNFIKFHRVFNLDVGEISSFEMLHMKWKIQ